MKLEAQSNHSTINSKQICREHLIQDLIIIDNKKSKFEFKIQTKYLAISLTITCKKIFDRFIIKYKFELQKPALKSNSKSDQIKIQLKLDLKKQLKFNLKLTIQYYKYD